MRNSLKALLASCAIVSLAAGVPAQQTPAQAAPKATPPSILAATPPAGPPGTTFVLLPPCRLTNATDTTTNPPAGVRRIDIKATRCGRIVPDFAVAYVLRKVTLDKTLPENARAGGRSEQIITVPATSNRLLDFTVPSNQDLAVDIYGYYAAAGTPVSPVLPPVSGTASGASPSIMSVGQARQPRPEQTVSGTTASVLTDAPFSGFGLALTATSNASYGWIATQTATSDASSGVAFFAGNGTKLLSARSDGAVQLVNGAFLDARTDFFGTAGSYYGFVAIPTNIVHDVTLIDPHDSAGGATNRIVFYNAQTDAEYGSPTVTKFRAATDGWDSRQFINFDSQINFHWPGNQLYHFRAFSALEGKDTFWVRPETNGTYNSNTRADMYVSGKVGIGTTVPSTQLDVTDALYAGSRMTGTGQQSSVLRGGYNAAYYSEIASYIPAGAPGVDSIGWKIRPYYYASPTGGRFDAVTVTPAGKVGIGIDPTALLQLAPPAGTVGFSQSANGTFYVDAPSIVGGRLAILEDGRVGIGTNNPAAGTRLDVAGAAHFLTNVTVDGVIYAKYQDVAEWVPSDGEMPAGTVVVLDRLKTNSVTPSSKAYDTAVAGVVSAEPGVLLGTAGSDKSKIATNGRVRVRVDARTNPVQVGDLLVTSDIPGTAMRSEPIDIAGIKLHRPGTLIGKALEPLAAGEGEILVLLSLQ